MRSEPRPQPGSQEQLGRADRALADAAIHLATHAAHGSSRDLDGLVVFAGGHAYPGPYCNGLVRLDRELEAGDAIARGLEFFSARRRGFVVWCRSGQDDDIAEMCRERGWFERPPNDGMPILLRDSDPGLAAEGPAAEPITTREQAAEYLGVVADAYEFEAAPAALLEAIFFTPAAVIADGAAGVLITVDGRAAAGAMSVTNDRASCVLWVATAHWARGRGLGPACMRAITHAGFAAGAELVVAQSSQMGLAHWIELGFVEVGSYRRFLAPRQA